MKINDISSLGLSQECINDLTFDHSYAVIHDEFCKRDRELTDKEKKLDYRTRGINRLIKAKLSFSNDFNITYDMVGRFIKVICPYCEKEMIRNSGGGAGNTCSSSFICKCGGQANLSLTCDGAFSFSHKEGTD